MEFIEGMVLAGMLVAKVSRKVEPGDEVFLPEHGESVHAAIVPSWKTNGVLVVEAKVTRPALAAVQK